MPNSLIPGSDTREATIASVAQTQWGDMKAEAVKAEAQRRGESPQFSETPSKSNSSSEGDV